jgi:protein O-GlcNAc transferase
MKIISFSLWGINRKYTVGAIRNMELVAKCYPSWQARFYVDLLVPPGIIYQLEDLGAKIVHMNEVGDWRGLFWRFEAARTIGADAIIFRDTDSRLNEREAFAVQEWLDSGKKFHILKDHPWHKAAPIMGGAWGVRGNVLRDIQELVQQHKSVNRYGTDYDFLNIFIYPRTIGESVTHDEFYGGQPFPTPRKGLDFFGQVFDEHEQTVPEHTEALRRWLQK